ncbi:hypothetical protein BASA50_002766 [Batrachochytrium salamandrivorans]|uniref:Nuclear pore complex NUP2/50/61 domain-containing protein n=1 Tax=Batrachochytrium salamandrivorans TaxID=1357716 RepID=A0ABQ8FNB4_9FUNG|nr:hypothetical protein BASA50_002766 [Batrachochytrium salamandrivorans]
MAKRPPDNELTSQNSHQVEADIEAENADSSLQSTGFRHADAGEVRGRIIKTPRSRRAVAANTPAAPSTAGLFSFLGTATPATGFGKPSSQTPMQFGAKSQTPFAPFSALATPTVPAGVQQMNSEVKENSGVQKMASLSGTPATAAMSFGSGLSSAVKPFSTGFNTSFTSGGSQPLANPFSFTPASTTTATVSASTMVSSSTLFISSDACKPSDGKLGESDAKQLESIALNLRGLNESFSSHIRSLIDTNCFQNLACFFEAYTVHHSKIMTDAGDLEIHLKQTPAIATSANPPSEISLPSDGVKSLTKAPFETGKTLSMPTFKPPMPPPNSSGFQPFAFGAPASTPASFGKAALSTPSAKSTDMDETKSQTPFTFKSPVSSANASGNLPITFGSATGGSGAPNGSLTALSSFGGFAPSKLSTSTTATATTTAATAAVTSVPAGSAFGPGFGFGAAPSPISAPTVSSTTWSFPKIDPPSKDTQSSPDKIMGTPFETPKETGLFGSTSTVSSVSGDTKPRTSFSFGGVSSLPESKSLNGFSSVAGIGSGDVSTMNSSSPPPRSTTTSSIAPTAFSFGSSAGSGSGGGGLTFGASGFGGGSLSTFGASDNGALTATTTATATAATAAAPFSFSRPSSAPMFSFGSGALPKLDAPSMFGGSMGMTTSFGSDSAPVSAPSGGGGGGGDDDEPLADEQVGDALMVGQGEEDETTEHEVRAKLFFAGESEEKGNDHSTSGEAGGAGEQEKQEQQQQHGFLKELEHFGSSDTVLQGDVLVLVQGTQGSVIKVLIRVRNKEIADAFVAALETAKGG